MTQRRTELYSNGELIETTFIDITWNDLRNHRNNELNNSDWRFMSDQTPSDEWIAYRVFLRDLPQNFFDESDEPSQGANAAADAWNEFNIPE